MVQRKDEVGHSGIYPATGPRPEGDVETITPGEINEGRTGRGHPHKGPGVERDEDLKNVERLPRKGNDDDAD